MISLTQTLLSPPTRTRSKQWQKATSISVRMTMAILVCMPLVIAIMVAMREIDLQPHGLFLSFQRFRILEGRKVLWLVEILKALMLSFSARRKIAGVPQSGWQKCTGLGELVCLQHLLDPMMHALWCLPTGTKDLVSRSSGAPCRLCRRRSLNTPKLMNVASASLDGLFGILFTTLQSTCGVAVLAGATEIEIKIA